MAPSEEPLTFELNEKVLCFHMDLLYDAKVIEVDSDDESGERQYKVHYRGWKNTWDDWVTADRMRKWTDENRQLAQTLINQAKEAQRQAAASAKAGKKAALVAAAAAATNNATTSSTTTRGHGPTMINHGGGSIFSYTNNNYGNIRSASNEIRGADSVADSTRGSEERGSAASGRGGIRRTAREYDVESVSETFEHDDRAVCVSLSLSLCVCVRVWACTVSVRFAVVIGHVHS